MTNGSYDRYTGSRDQASGLLHFSGYVETAKTRETSLNNMRSALLLLCGMLAYGQEAPPTVFRSDVALLRVDVQALDRDNKPITGLQQTDFVLTESGKPQQIRNFQSENMPLDVVLLFDVSRSMRPHVERIVSAAHQALRVLGRDDRVGIMVFDRSSRVRLPFRSNLDDVERELDSTVKRERFDGGTDITRALFDAATYVSREARPTARRAIVILTDDQTESARERNDEAVGRALARADAVLSLLLAPNAMDYSQAGGPDPGSSSPAGGQGRSQGRSQGRGGRSGGMGGIGGGGPMGGGGIWGPSIPRQRYPQGGNGPYGGGNARTKSAGTPEIARASGGDDFSVDDAGALETTLNRLRQRYALHFNSPDAPRSIDVQLTEAAARRYPNAELRFRRVSSGNEPSPREPLSVSRTAPSRSPAPRASAADEPESPRPRRRPAVSEGSGPAGPVIQLEPPPLI